MSEITQEQWLEHQAEKAEHERQETARFFDEFWRPIVCNQDGTIDQDKLNAELWDYYTFMGSAAEVYCEITGNQISKINTLPQAIIAVHEDHVQECIREAVEEETEDLRSRIATLESQLEQARTALEEAAVTMTHARTFIFSRLKMHPTGIALYDEATAALQALREGGEG